MVTRINTTTDSARTNSAPIAAIWLIVNRIAHARTAPTPVAVNASTNSTMTTVLTRWDQPPCMTPATAATATAEAASAALARRLCSLDSSQPTMRPAAPRVQ
jgi:hypothetical protein